MKIFVAPLLVGAAHVVASVVVIKATATVIITFLKIIKKGALICIEDNKILFASMTSLILPNALRRTHLLMISQYPTKMMRSMQSALV